jgi:hypothetical protein
MFNTPRRVLSAIDPLRFNNGSPPEKERFLTLSPLGFVLGAAAMLSV